MKPLYVIGSGGHSRPVIDVALQLGKKIPAIIDLNYSKEKQESIFGVPVKGGMELIEELDPAACELFLAIGDNALRAKMSKELTKKGFEFCRLISPTAIVSPRTTMGEGVFINAGCVINAGCNLGNHTIINTAVVIDHECQLADYCHVAPGTSIAGRVKVGEGTFIGIGSSVIDYITIGDHVTIGAGSVIVKDIPRNAKVIGVSKIIT